MEETTVWKGRSSQVLNLKVYVACGVIAFVLLAVLGAVAARFTETLPPLLIWIDVALLLIPLGIAVREWLKLRFRTYLLTTERFLISHGIFSKQTDTLELYRVKDLTLLQPFFLRLFSVGNVVLQTSDRTTPTLVIEAIANPKDFSDMVRKQVEACRDRKRVGELDMNESIEQ